jgi:hypothetical protein
LELGGATADCGGTSDARCFGRGRGARARGQCEPGFQMVVGCGRAGGIVAAERAGAYYGCRSVPSSMRTCAPLGRRISIAAPRADEAPTFVPVRLAPEPAALVDVAAEKGGAPSPLRDPPSAARLAGRNAQHHRPLSVDSTRHRTSRQSLSRLPTRRHAARIRRAVGGRGADSNRQKFTRNARTGRAFGSSQGLVHSARRWWPSTEPCMGILAAFTAV